MTMTPMFKNKDFIKGVRGTGEATIRTSSWDLIFTIFMGSVHLISADVSVILSVLVWVQYKDFIYLLIKISLEKTATLWTNEPYCSIWALVRPSLPGLWGLAWPLGSGLESWLRAGQWESSWDFCQGLSWKGSDPGAAGGHKRQPKSQCQSRGKMAAH